MRLLLAAALLILGLSACKKKGAPKGSPSKWVTVVVSGQGVDLHGTQLAPGDPMDEAVAAMKGESVRVTSGEMRIYDELGIVIAPQGNDGEGISIILWARDGDGEDESRPKRGFEGIFKIEGAPLSGIHSDTAVRSVVLTIHERSGHKTWVTDNGDIQVLVGEGLVTFYFNDGDDGEATINRVKIDLKVAPSGDEGLPKATCTEDDLVAASLEGKAIPEVDTDGYSALHRCVIKNFARSSAALIKKGADMSARDTLGRTPLHLAAMYAELPTINVLIDAGANLDVPEPKTGFTPLHLAANRGNDAIVARLIEAGADPAKRTVEGWTAIHFAAGKGHRGVVKRLAGIKGMLMSRDNNGMTALHHAAFRGKDHCVKDLLDLGVNVNVSDRYNSTPLFNAALAGHSTTVELLVGSGAEVNVRAPNGRTALDATILKGHTTAAKMLRKAGAKTGAELEAERKERR